MSAFIRKYNIWEPGWKSLASAIACQAVIDYQGFVRRGTVGKCGNVIAGKSSRVYDDTGHQSYLDNRSYACETVKWLKEKQQELYDMAGLEIDAAVVNQRLGITKRKEHAQRK
jgi:hypothetical protein